MKSFRLIIFLFLVPYIAFAQKMKPEDTEVWEPEPKIVTPGKTNSEPPSDAVVLFDGKNLAAWESSKKQGEAAAWDISEDIITVKAGSGAIQTKRSFGDVQLHIEWRTPLKIESEGQGRGNSGVFLQGKYEVQILDSYQNKTYSNGQAGSIYKQHIPLANAMRGTGEWQSYDIIFMAPRFTPEGEIEVPARITVIHNGVLIQNNVILDGPTEYIGYPKYKPHGKAPITLQDHGNPVSFRNIWLREL